jgi:hypothetical protein
VFLKELLPESHAVLDAQAGGRPDGIVLRGPGRSTIVKLRFKDYLKLTKGKRRS